MLVYWKVPSGKLTVCELENLQILRGKKLLNIYKSMVHGFQFANCNKLPEGISHS